MHCNETASASSRRIQLTALPSVSVYVFRSCTSSSPVGATDEDPRRYSLARGRPRSWTCTRAILAIAVVLFLSLLLLALANIASDGLSMRGLTWMLRGGRDGRHEDSLDQQPVPGMRVTHHTDEQGQTLPTTPANQGADVVPTYGVRKQDDI